MKKYFIFVFLCMFQFAFADTVKLDLQSAINLAYENNSDLKRQKIALDAALRSSKKSYNTLIPSVSVSANDTYSFPNEEPANNVNIEGNVSLNLKPSIKFNADKTKINYQIEKTNYDILQNTIRQTVCDSFFEILEVNEQLVLKTKNIQILKDLYEENKLKYKKGFISEIEYLNSKILYEKSKSELIVQQLEVKNLTNSFKLLLGLPVSNEVELNSNLTNLFKNYSSHFTEQYQSEVLAQQNINNLPELKILVCQKQLFEKELQIKKLDNFGPDINVSYQVNPILRTEETKGKIKNTVNAGITIPLDNLIPVSQGREEINLANDQITDMNIQISAKTQEIENTLNNLLLIAKQKITTLESCKKLVEVTNNNLNICKTSYSKGMLDFQSLKTANTEYLQAQLEYSNMILDILKTFSNIEQISGKAMIEVQK